jgi:hypothetical protein
MDPHGGWRIEARSAAEDPQCGELDLAASRVELALKEVRLRRRLEKTDDGNPV